MFGRKVDTNQGILFSCWRRLKLSFAVALLSVTAGHANAELEIATAPLFAVTPLQPLVMLNMSSDSQLFFNAFPEFADLSGDGQPDLGYVHSVDYFGYFDPFKCYSYTTDNRFVPISVVSDKRCPGENWSGNFLNWLTMARIDTIRKILYGGKRRDDTDTLTVLERTHLPNDAHSWVRFYDGTDINDFTPFTQGSESSVETPSAISWRAGSRRGAGDQVWMATPGWTAAQVQLGDQVELTHPDFSSDWMRGVVIDFDTGGTERRIRVQVTGSSPADPPSEDYIGWTIVNRSRKGVSFCNTTITTGASHGATARAAAPLLLVAQGNYSLWTGSERWQCRWGETVSPNVPDRMRIANRPFHNGNDVVSSGLWANSTSPARDAVRLGGREFTVRVEVCREGLLEENCQKYPSEVHKPIGLLQEFGDEGELQFGLMTGSISRHVSGGVLRRNISRFTNEVNQQTGQFLRPAESIVATLDALRIYGYNHGTGQYTSDDENCVFGTSKAEMIAGRCLSWGNPQAEIFAESLRYLAGKDPNTNFSVDDSGFLTGLSFAQWRNPMTEARYCDPLNIIQFNASITSFDDGAPAAAADLPGLGTGGLTTWTDEVGRIEGINGANIFFGGADGFCEANDLATLSTFRGVCPEAPNQDGTYHIAGLAKFAAQADLRPDWPEEQSVRTIGVSLAPAVPRIDIPRPGGGAPVTILPACDNRGDNLRCQLTDFRIVEQEQDIQGGTGTGIFFIQWDVSEWGADNDMDVSGTLRYKITGTQIEVTTQTWADSSGRETGFGYIISGVGEAGGFHAHSGINGYRRTGLGADGASVPTCTACNVADAPSTATFTLGGGAARLLREPLYYAAKFGGGGGYFLAVDPAELLTQLRQVFEEISGDLGQVALGVNTNRLEADTLSFDALLNEEDWTGELLAAPAAGSQLTPWAASAKLAGTVSRNILTSNGSQTTSFDSSLPSAIKDELFAGVEVLRGASDENCPSGSDDIWFCALDNSDKLISFIRGSAIDPSDESGEPGALRERSSLLGTVINSDLVVSPMPDANEGWGRIDTDYFDHLDTKLEILENDNAAVFVGSNAGMLHAFRARDGEELFAYIPSMVRDRLYRQANPLFQHEPYVDGRFAIVDAKVGNSWKTVLVGGLGGGGKGLYAIDVTNPSVPEPNRLLWELDPDNLSDVNDTRGGNIGHIFAAPVVTRLANGKFVVVFGNGINPADRVPELFVVDLSTGDIIDSQRVTEDDPEANGLMGVGIALSVGQPNRPTRTDVERAYAGDQAGRLWRFRFDENGIEDVEWLFEARSPDRNLSQAQPITAPPTVAINIQGGWDVFFGTGRLLAVGDNITAENEVIQSFYRVLDRNQPSNDLPLRRSDLGSSSVTGVSRGVDGRDRRTIAVETFSSNGWMLDFVDESGGVPVQNGSGVDEGGLRGTGERMLVRPTVGFGAVLLTTYEPTVDACEGGGSVRLYVLDTDSGGGTLRTDADDAAELGTVVFEGSRAPASPPIIMGSPPVDDDDNGGPGDGEVVLLPDPEGIDRLQWCSRFGFTSDGAFQTLGTVCDGRQVWRQIWLDN